MTSLVIKHLPMKVLQTAGKALLEEHYQELTLNKDVVVLDPDWSRYEAMEALDILYALGAWEDGELVGYSLFIVQKHLHYKGLLAACNDVLYLRKDRRLGPTGVRLVKESEKMLGKLGTIKIVWHVKYDTTLGPLLEHLGYVREEYSVGKLLRS